jgi:hypothetical protein
VYGPNLVKSMYVTSHLMCCPCPDVRLPNQEETTTHTTVKETIVSNQHSTGDQSQHSIHT